MTRYGLAQWASRHRAPLLLAAQRAVFAITAVVFLSVHNNARLYLPGSPDEHTGWGGWFDQGKYIEAARAWWSLDVSQVHHWYPPGYALLAAPFLSLTPHDRFLLPNLVCLLVSQYACMALGGRLFPQWRAGRLIGAGAFGIASMLLIQSRITWIVPWTTTPATALILVSLVAALRLAENPGFARALAAGACIGAIPLFRPADAIPVALAAAIVLAPALLASRRGRTAAWAAVLAAAAVAGATVALIAATAGLGPGTYVGSSAQVGFEWRLLPLRWVTLMISPRPLWSGVLPPAAGLDVRHGLAEIFPWIAPGVAGVAVALASRPRRVHVLLALWVAGHLALTLCYRDLHVQGLWGYYNAHYFKPALPVLLLFTVVLIERLADPAVRGRAALVAAVAVVAAFGWRARLEPGGPVPPGLALEAHAVTVPPLATLGDAAIVRATGRWDDLYFGAPVLVIGGRDFANFQDFRLYPRAQDVVVVPLRVLPPGPGVLRLAEGVTLDASIPAMSARQTIGFGLPCAFGLAGRARCGDAR